MAASGRMRSMTGGLDALVMREPYCRAISRTPDSTHQPGFRDVQ
ncbi:hypothetical protein QFZ27_007489 [Inquilinus ginsengisoli]